MVRFLGFQNVTIFWFHSQSRLYLHSLLLYLGPLRTLRFIERFGVRSTLRPIDFCH